MTQMLSDGFSTTISLNSGAIKLYERTVKPPGISGGGAINKTTMRNTTWRTFAAKRLKTLTESSLKCGYDVAVYPQIVTNCQVNQLITVTFPDGATLAFWGFIDEFEPDDLEEGNFPMATVKIVPTNCDTTGTEVAPVYTTPA